MRQAAGGPGAQQVRAQHGMAELGSRERLLNLGRRCEGLTAGLQVPGSELRGRRGAGLRASGEQGGGV